MLADPPISCSRRGYCLLRPRPLFTINLCVLAVVAVSAAPSALEPIVDSLSRSVISLFDDSGSSNQPSQLCSISDQAGENEKTINLPTALKKYIVVGSHEILRRQNKYPAAQYKPLTPSRCRSPTEFSAISVPPSWWF